MKKTFLLIALLTSTFYLFAQDVIIRTNGDNIKCKITKVDSTNVYFTFDRNGNTISSFLNKSQIQSMEKVVAKSGEEKKQKDENNFTPKVGLFFNPLGFIQFGPILGAEILCTKNFTIEGHVRLSSLGLLMYAISHNDNGDAPYSISGTGIGGGCEYFLPGRSGGLYIGLLMELGSQTSLYYQDSQWDNYQDDSNYFVFLFNVGYKFTFQSGFYIKTGGFLGFADIYKGKWYNIGTNTDKSIHTDNSKIIPDGFAELTFGIDF